jgi:hypothetical protein
MNVAKVDLNAVYVAMVVHVCANVSSMFSDLLLQVCLYGYYIRFIHMMQVFYLDIEYVCNSYQVAFVYFCKCFRSIFQVFHLSSRMLRVLHLDVSKIDRVLPMLQCA